MGQDWDKHGNGITQGAWEPSAKEIWSLESWLLLDSILCRDRECPSLENRHIN